MSRYVYPGHSSPLVLHSYLAAVARTPFELVCVHEDRHNYYLTCKAWGAAGRGPGRGDPTLGGAAVPALPAVPLGVGGRLRDRQVQAYRWVLRLPDLGS